ncbi:diguanylate cyclase [Pseudoxanthomonas sp.]|uniref:diguanylate cyclase n=1 Tax=Pseudoxanthomonas sp. TaxID=1871049 RepID=UPI003F7DC4C4
MRPRQANRLGLFLAALIFVAIGAGVFYGAQRFISDANRVTHTNEVIALIGDIESAVHDSESAQRGYLLTGNVSYLADYGRGRDQLPDAITRLQKMVRDNPEQSRRVTAWRIEILRRLSQMEATLGNYRLGGLDAARRSINHEVRQASVNIHHQAEELVAAERELLALRARSSHDSANLLRGLALLGIPLGLAVIGLVYWLLVGEIRRRASAEAASSDARRQLMVTIEKLEAHGADLNDLSRYSGMLQSCVRSEEAIRLATQHFSRLLPNVGGTLYRIRASQDYAEEAAHWGEHALHSGAMFPLEACWALRRGQPHMHRAHAEMLGCTHLVAPALHAEPTTACIPLIAQGTQLGLLYLSSHDDGFLARQDLVETAAEQLSMALSNLELQERLRIQSIREPLTGLFNRRYLEESLARELARCERRGLPLSVMMMDLDHFKAFNDLHGHVGGDTLLSGFGQLLLRLARAEDIACRYGGEEFTLILPETDAETARERAESIRAAVAAMRIRHMGQELPAVTVSIGVASFPLNGREGESLIRHADEALYRAKRGGRDRVEMAAVAGGQRVSQA